VRRSAAVFALLALALAACTPPQAEAPPAPPALDCARGFEALSAAIAAAPGVIAAPRTPGEPYRFYNAEDGSASYLVTEPGAPGHPAILKQESASEAGRKVMRNTGCPYGDAKGYAGLEAYLASLAAARAR